MEVSLGAREVTSIISIIFTGICATLLALPAYVQHSYTYSSWHWSQSWATHSDHIMQDIAKGSGDASVVEMAEVDEARRVRWMPVCVKVLCVVFSLTAESHFYYRLQKI